MGEQHRRMLHHVYLGRNVEIKDVFKNFVCKAIDL